MDSYNREFKGIWIPAEIWLNEDLTIAEKALFAEIDSLDGENGCYASNEYLAKFCNSSESFITKAISKLKRMGYIKSDGFDGRTRVLRVVKFTMQDSTIDESPSDKNEFLLYRENKKENNIEKTPAERVSSTKTKHTRNFRREYEKLTDDLYSGEEIKKQTKEIKKRTKQEKCLALIDLPEFNFNSETKTLLKEYIVWAMSGTDNRKITGERLCKRKLEALVMIAKKNNQPTEKIVQQSIDNKWYKFVELQEKKKYDSPGIPNDDIIPQKLHGEEVKKELERREREVGVFL